MYEMKEEFKTNIAIIDEQHKRLFEIANEAYTLLTNEFVVDKYDEIIEIINELKSYTKFHFKTEENYMESIGYRKIFSQKVAHKEFIDELEKININDIDLNQEKAIRELLSFLNSWLIDHILHCDKLIGNI